MNKWKGYWRQMQGTEYEDLSNINMEFTQVGDELNEEVNRWCENRSGWVNDGVTECIDQRKMQIRIIVTRGVDDIRTTHMKYIYIYKYIYENERRSRTGSWYGFTSTL